MIKTFKAFSVSLALLAVILGNSGNILSEQTSQPNIILILTDDQDAPTVAFMPRLKELLVDQGTTFTNGFVTYSLCCPSRASIQRGQYVHNHQVLTNTPPDGGFQKFRSTGDEKSTVATWLQAAGYRTVLIGKYLNGYPGNEPTYVPPGWSEWYGVHEAGGYSFYNYRINENGTVVSYGSHPEDYGTDVFARKATDFIRRAAADGKPFFVYLSTYAPHDAPRGVPPIPAPRHQNEFADATAPRLPSFNEEDVSDKPKAVRRRPLLSSEQIAKIDERYRRRLQSVLAIDEMIASVVETLQATSQLEKTYIFFTSDNGWHQGEHRISAGKGTAYEEAIGVPFIVRGPGVPAGQALEHLVLNIDLAPTFAELAGASAPDFVDGRSLVPLLRSNPPSLENWRQGFLVEFWASPQSQPARPLYQALRTYDYKYVEWASGERELYDLKKDLYEMESSHATAGPALLQKLASWLEALRRCAGASCREADSAPPSSANSLAGRSTPQRLQLRP